MEERDAAVGRNGMFPSGKEQSGLPLGNNVFAVGVAERAEGFKTSCRIDGLSEAWEWERRARHEEAGELKLYKTNLPRSLRQISDVCLRT